VVQLKAHSLTVTVRICFEKVEHLPHCRRVLQAEETKHVMRYYSMMA
jgi:hypothetical protein